MMEYLIEVTSKNVDKFVIEAKDSLDALEIAMEFLLDEIDDSIVEVSFDIKNVTKK